MRIAFVTFEYPPHVNGGAGVYAENVTKELSNLGNTIVVFTPMIDGSDNKTVKINNLEIIKIKTITSLPFKALQFWLRLPKYLEQAQNEGKFDIIHFNGISYWFIKKRLIKARHVVTIHHLVKDEIKSSNNSLLKNTLILSGWINFFIALLEKRCINNVDKIISVSDFTKKQILSYYQIPSDKIETIYNGVNITNFTAIEDIERVREKYKLPNKPILLFVGRIDDHRKGLDILLRVFQKVLQKIDVILLIVGKGNRTKIELLATSLGVLNNIYFTGFVDDITLRICYKLSSVYVVPSRFEGFGLTIIEAMIENKPIVATNVGAIPEIISDYPNGFIVDPTNIDEMENIIYRLLTNPNLYYSLNIADSNILDRITIMYNWRTNAINLEKIYRVLLNIETLPRF